jgi:transaldolase/glucose-6-phosphate isomerase
VSFEVSPFLAHQTQPTIEYARRVHKLIGRENILIKVPGTPEGMPAITTLVSEGISVNVTLLFAVEAYEACAEAYLKGLEAWAAKGKNPGAVASVASFFISRIDTLVDQQLAKASEGEHDAARRSALQGLQGRVAVANGIIAYDRYKSLIASDRWRALAAKGAQTQRVLWASTSTKNKSYPKTKYVDELIAKDTVNTIPEETFDEYRAHGEPAPALDKDWQQKLAGAREVMSTLERLGLSMRAATDQLLKEGVDKFSEAFETLLKAVEKKRNLLRAA